MKFLIDGHRLRVVHRWQQWPDGVAGQLLTPLTSYHRCAEVFAVDNGAYGGFKKKPFMSLLAREQDHKDKALFVSVPDMVGCHKTSLAMFEELQHLCDGWRKAFVAQNGFDGLPAGVPALFIGGTDTFKNSDEVLQIVRYYVHRGIHVHVIRPSGFYGSRRPGRTLVMGVGLAGSTTRSHAYGISPGYECLCRWRG